MPDFDLENDNVNGSSDAAAAESKQRTSDFIGSRNVVDGERLSGHRRQGAEDYQIIHILDGNGPGGGSLIFSIACFHWADVVVSGSTTELWFKGGTCFAISDGIAKYAE